MREFTFEGKKYKVENQKAIEIGSVDDDLFETSFDEIFDYLKEKGLSEDFAEWKIKRFKPKKCRKEDKSETEKSR